MAASCVYEVMGMVEVIQDRSLGLHPKDGMSASGSSIAADNPSCTGDLTGYNKLTADPPDGPAWGLVVQPSLSGLCLISGLCVG